MFASCRTETWCKHWLPFRNCFTRIDRESVDGHVSLATRLQSTIVTPVVCVDARQRPMCKKNSVALVWHSDNFFRALSSLPLHFIRWSTQHISGHSTCFVLMYEHPWVKCILPWNAGGARLGRSFFQSKTGQLTNIFSYRWHQLGDWYDTAGYRSQVSVLCPHFRGSRICQVVSSRAELVHQIKRAPLSTGMKKKWNVNSDKICRRNLVYTQSRQK